MKPLHVALVISLGSPFVAAPTLAVAAQPPAATANVAPAVEPAALGAIRRMSAYLQTLSGFVLQSETSLDVVTEGSQRVQLDGITTYKVSRANAFVITVNSDVKKRTFYYDGKTFTVFAPELGFYATVAAPPTTRLTLDAIREKFGITLPLEDLFRWSDPANHRGDALVSAFAVGPATIGGVETEQYAFREGDIDWQVWIQKGDQPLPRKLMIVDRTDPANPAYVARLTWNVNPNLSADDFVFRPGKDVKAIKLTAAGQ